MSQNLIVNGVTYTYPDTGDTNWGPDATAWAVAVTQNMLQRSGGLFTISAEVDFGSSFGLKALYYKSRTANIAATGIVRLAVSDKISWRNNANSADLELGVDGSNNLTWQGVPLASIVVSDTNSIDLTYAAPNLSADLRLDGSTLTIGAGGVKVTDLGLADAQISLTAAIAYSKLALSNSIVDGDINAAAAIAYSKLALSNSIVNGDIAALAAIAYSKLNLALSIVDGDISTTAAIAYSKLNLALSIVNGDISTTAAIDLSKLAVLTIDRALVSSGTGVISVSSVTATELGYLSGVTSPVQTQIGGKANQALDNLASVAINTSLVSDTANTDDLGTSAIPWRNAYLKTGLILQETGAGTDAVQVEGPAAITTGYRVAMPDTAPTVAGYALKVKTVGTPNVLEWGEAGGQGGINYIGNNDAEADTTGWATFADAASATPADGTGGSPNVTWTRNTSSPLRNNADFLFTKDAANRQGQGVSYDFTIDSADKAKPIYISFDYLPSANYADDQMSVWIYDVTNALIVQPAPYLIKKVNAADKFAAVFQSASNSTSYRLIVYVGGTSASAYTVKFDNFTVGPSYAVMGSPVTDWVAYTPTLGGTTTDGTMTFLWQEGYSRRVGDSLEVVAYFELNTVSVAPTGNLTISLPSGLSIDHAKDTNIGTINYCQFYDFSGSAYIPAHTNFPGSLTTKVRIEQSSSVAIPTLAASDQIRAHFVVPIVGWSSSVLMSDNADTRVVAAKYDNTAGTLVTSSGVDLPWATSARSFDTHGGMNTATGVYTIPVSGVYTVSGGFTTQSAIWSATNALLAQAVVNGSTTVRLAYKRIDANVTTAQGVYGSATVKLNAGDTITFNALTSINTNLDTTQNVNWVAIQRISGPSQIAATETVAARYSTTGTPTISSDTLVDFSTKDYDSHGSVTTGASWKFTAPVSGIYRVAAGMLAATPKQELYVELFKNGSLNQYLGAITSTDAASQRVAMGTGSVRLLAGDYIDIRESVSPTTSALSSNANFNWVAIERVGNY